MAFDSAAVAAYLRVEEAQLVDVDTVVAAVLSHAEKRYTNPSDADTPDAGDVATWERALTMQAARLCKRVQSVSGVEGGGGDRPAIYVTRFDPDVQTLLSDFLIVGGIFGTAPEA